MTVSPMTRSAAGSLLLIVTDNRAYAALCSAIVFGLTGSVSVPQSTQQMWT